jgi:hypothetical protein
MARFQLLQDLVLMRFIECFFLALEHVELLLQVGAVVWVDIASDGEASLLDRNSGRDTTTAKKIEKNRSGVRQRTNNPLD